MIHDAANIKKELSRALLAWYKQNSRALPWRETNDPYRIWISEVMLQQTQVDTVIPYYRRFFDVFPDILTLACAPLEQVLKVWENLGYYTRAKNIHKAARRMVDQFGSRIPDTEDAIKTLPGIGDYTAGAILSIAYGKALPAVDGNVRRILSRIFAIRKPVDDPREHKELQTLAATLIPARQPGDYNQALMDLGATLCRPKNPDCKRCPIAGFCRAYHLGLQSILPITRKAPAIPRRLAAAAVIRGHEGRLLVVQRPATGLLASLWKLPGGFVEDNISLDRGLKQRVKEELGLTIRVGPESDVRPTTPIHTSVHPSRLRLSLIERSAHAAWMSELALGNVCRPEKVADVED